MKHKLKVAGSALPAGLTALENVNELVGDGEGADEETSLARRLILAEAEGRSKRAAEIGLSAYAGE